MATLLQLGGCIHVYCSISFFYGKLINLGKWWCIYSKSAMLMSAMIMTIFQRWIIFMTYFWPLSREQLTFQIPRSVSKFNWRALWIVDELLKYIVLHLIYLHSTSYTYLKWTLNFMFACLFQSQKMCYNIMRKLIETWGESIF